MKKISTKGDVINEEDIISTLEQENRQLRARIERMEREQRPANESQISVMWQLCNSNPVPFARMLESYHGIGEVVGNV